MCECYKIGGPFVSYDPDCPAHGDDAQRREAERAAELEEAMDALREVTFDPKKLRIKIRHRRDYGGVNDIMVSLFYDGKEISSDSMGLPDLRSYPSGYDD